MGVISFYDVAKAVVDGQDFENRMLKAYIRDWPVDEPADVQTTGGKASVSAQVRQHMSGSTLGHLFPRHQLR